MILGPLRLAVVLAALLVCTPVALAGSAGSYSAFDQVFDGSLIAARPSDIDGDGLTDLLLVTGRSAGKQRFETSTRGNAIFAELVSYQVTEMSATALIQQAGGVFATAGQPLPLPRDCIAFDLADLDGDGFLDLLLLDDNGVEVRFRHPGGWLEDGLRILETTTTFSGCRKFFGGLRFLEDLDGDGGQDVLLPCYGETLVRFAPQVGTKEAAPAEPLRLASGVVNHHYGNRRMRTRFPLPRAEDCNGDGLVDLLFHLPDSVQVFVQQPGRAFAPPHEVVFPEAREGEERAGRHFGDMTGDGVADLLLFHTLEGDNDSFREAKNPKTWVELFPGRADLSYPEGPVSRSLIRGAVAAGDDEGYNFPAISDLNGDGLNDILGISFDVGMFQLVKLATVQRITVEFIFQNYLQNERHGFPGQAVHEVKQKIRINLRDLEMPDFPFFSGDFNGDGINDFVRFGGDALKVHISAGDGTYSKRPGLTFDLPRGARDPDLMLVSELDDDALSDLLVFKAGQGSEENFRVVIYTSGGGGGS